jgi:hypothetical protein
MLSLFPNPWSFLFPRVPSQFFLHSAFSVFKARLKCHHSQEALPDFRWIQQPSGFCPMLAQHWGVHLPTQVTVRLPQ